MLNMYGGCVTEVERVILLGFGLLISYSVKLGWIIPYIYAWKSIHLTRAVHKIRRQPALKLNAGSCQHTILVQK